MDDYSLSSLSESKNEWCSRLVDTLTPAIIEGLRSIYNESLKLCIESDEEEKYLMTFQTFLVEFLNGMKTSYRPNAKELKKVLTVHI